MNQEQTQEQASGQAQVQTNATFVDRINTLDTSLFDGILSQTTDEDRSSLLAVQRAVRRIHPKYSYLEIGSYLGGTIQPHLRDPACKIIYTIDKRPRVLPDERDGTNTYEDNTTEHMMRLLAQFAPDQMHKIVAFEGDARDVDPSAIKEAPNLCFIDGEHTNRAVISDFEFCMQVCARDAVIVFHDSARVFRGLQFIQSTCKVPYQAMRLGGSVYSIMLGHNPVAQDPAIRKMGKNGPLYLQMLKAREIYQNHFPQSVRNYLKPLLRPITTQLPR